MRKLAFANVIAIFLFLNCYSIFAVGTGRGDFFLSLSPLSFHFAESKSREATGYGFELKNGFNLYNAKNPQLFYGAELSGDIYSFDTYKHFDYGDVILLGRIGYEFPLNDKWYVSPSLKCGLFLGFLDGETDCFGTVGGDVSFDYTLTASKKLVLSESILYVFQDDAHSVLLNSNIGFKFAISGREES